MSRKHFEHLASVLKSNKPDKKSALVVEQWLKDCEAVAKACQNFNANFDRERFLEACGIEL